MADPTDPQGKEPAIDVLVVHSLASRLAQQPAVTDDHGRSLLQITSAIANAVAAEDVYIAIVDHVAAALSASSCALWLRDGHVVRLARHVGYSSRAEQAFTAVPIDSDVALPFLDVIRRAEPIWIPSQRALLEMYPHVQDTATQGRAYRVSCLPLVVDGVALGALGITLDEEREATASERSFLLLVARYATQALERLRIVDAERRSRQRADAVARRMTILSHASRAFSEVHVDHEQRILNIVREVGTLIDSAATLALIREDGRLHVVATYHPDAEADAISRSLAERFPWTEGEGVSGKVLQTGQSVLLSTLDPAVVAERAPTAYREYFERFPIHAAMVAPLRVRGRNLGTITATRVRAGRPYDADDMELLEGLAERAASAIENSRLHRDAEEARRRAEHLYRFANAAVNAETIEQVFDAALAAIAEALRAERASILLFDDDDVIRFKAWRGLSDEYRAAVEGHSPWRRDEKAPQPIMVADCLHDAAWASYEALFRREGVAALGFIPLVSRGCLLGKFMVYYGEPHVFSTSDIDVAQAIGNYLAAMIARFRAVADLEQTIRDNELFAGVLAHDLRNPLGAILTATQLALMQNEGAGERTQRPLSRILTSTDRMTRMIEQLLDFTRARVGGGIEIRPCSTSLVDIAKQAVAELELVHADRTLDIEVHGDHYGVWDPDRLLQLVSNLVGNACQHGSTGCAVRITIDGTAANSVTLSVHNDGAIPVALVAHLFDPFRGRERRRGDARGLGLGLYIVRAIARAHHGTVDVSSTPDAGTTFVVKLPRA